MGEHTSVETHQELVEGFVKGIPPVVRVRLHTEDAETSYTEQGSEVSLCARRCKGGTYKLEAANPMNAAPKVLSVFVIL